MNIVDAHLAFKREEERRPATNYIILHHTGESVLQSVEVLNEFYKNRKDDDYLGIGYNFYVRKSGEIDKGRDMWAQGGHCYGHNNESVGICFEGNFEVEQMNDVQLGAGVELLKYVKSVYPSAQFKKHKDFNSTDCPGKNFPFDRMIAAANNSAPTPAPAQPIIRYMLLQDMNMRNAPDGNSIISVIPKGTVITPIKTTKSQFGTLWASCSCNGKSGYVAVDTKKGYAKVYNGVSTPRYQLTQQMSLRIIPDGFKLGNIPTGTVITPIKTVKSLLGTLWAQCIYNGRKGYVAVDTKKGYAKTV